MPSTLYDKQRDSHVVDVAGDGLARRDIDSYCGGDATTPPGREGRAGADGRPYRASPANGGSNGERGAFCGRSRFTMKENSMKPAMIILAVALALSGCNTLQGIGKDLEKGGQAIEKAAK